uniref:Uncharacterized protein n=1 Tax=viral metagenome TaxID=1070528 RepID=A0A6C0B026_9ZZZZ
MVQVNSSLYDRFFKGGKGIPMRTSISASHFPTYNLMIGGKKQKKNSGSGTNSLFQLLNSKKEFLLAVFANLITQLGITYYVMINYPIDNKTDKTTVYKSSTYWICLFVTLAIIFILAFVSMPSWLKFILFCIFSISWGILLSFLKLTVDSQAIQMAIFGAMAIFGVMFLFGAFLLLFGVSLGFAFSCWLFFALLLFLIVQIVVGFSGTYSMFHKAIAVVGLILFSLYIVYDTNTILQRNYYGDFITASLDYYLDILNIFLDLLSYNQN